MFVKKEEAKMRKIILITLLILMSGSHAQASLNYALFFDGFDDFVKVPDSNSLDLSTGRDDY